VALGAAPRPAEHLAALGDAVEPLAPPSRQLQLVPEGMDAVAWELLSLDARAKLAAGEKLSKSERQAEVRVLLPALRSLERVGAVLNVSHTTIKKDRGELGIAPNPVGQPRKHPPPEPRPCWNCGKVFEPLPGNRGHYCDRDCANAAKSVYPDPVERPCEHCGESFMPKRNEIDRRYCGKPCADAAKAKYPPPEPRACARRNCDVVFTPKHPSAAANGEGLYCSRRCTAIASSLSMKFVAAAWYWTHPSRLRWRGRLAPAVATEKGKKVGRKFEKVDAEKAARILRLADERRLDGKPRHSQRTIARMVGVSRGSVQNVIKNRARVVVHFALDDVA
jgi:hypothetical protein